MEYFMYAYLQKACLLYYQATNKEERGDRSTVVCIPTHDILITTSLSLKSQ